MARTVARLLALLAMGAAGAVGACGRASGRAPGAEDVAPGGAAAGVIDSIMLERGPCFGVCPVYRLTITGAGRVAIEDRGRPGPAPSPPIVDSIAPAAVARLATAADRAGFWTLPNDIRLDRRLCPMPATDHSTVVVSLFRASGVKRVSHYTGCYVAAGPPTVAPEVERLRGLEAMIDSVAGVARRVQPPGRR